MHPELFEIPFTNVTVKSYGLMMVIGFLAAVFVARRLARYLNDNPDYVINGALYALIAGVVGARIFYVIHYFEEFRGRTLAIFAVWEGGLELLGGVFIAMAVLLLYMWRHKLAVRKYLDIIAVAMPVALVFGRLGCFLNGCCFGEPTQGWWGIRFPYGSPVYHSQVYPDAARGRENPRLDLPVDYFGYYDSKDSKWIGAVPSYKFTAALKPYSILTPAQQYEVTYGKYRCLAVHPTQLYESAFSFFLFVVFYMVWRRNIRIDSGFLSAEGNVFGLLFILYGVWRFLIEFIRDDNPFEFDGLTVSQNLSMGMVLVGVVLIFVFSMMRNERKKTTNCRL